MLQLGELQATDSLLARTDLEVGDVVCVHHEAARDTAGGAAASAGADSGPVTRAALLVWTVAAEVRGSVLILQDITGCVHELSTLLKEHALKLT